MLLQKVIDSVRQNLGNDAFSVDQLGDCVNMSRSNLFRKLKALTGQTPLDFIYTIRLNHAMALLLERNHTIAEIADLVGFKSRSSFTKSFHRTFGKAPTEFLNDILAKQID